MTKPAGADRDLQLSLLRQVEAFRRLDDDVLRQIADTSVYQEVQRGEVLIREGDPAATLYIVLKGRFVVTKGEGKIAEVSLGEPIGELAFFAGGTRTASVIAARNSTVMALSKTAYDDLAERTPDLAKGILRALSQRLVQTIVPRPDTTPRPGRICSVLPGGDGPIDARFADHLRAAFADARDWVVMDETACPADLRGDVAGLTAWVEEQEATGPNMVLLCVHAEGNDIWRKVIVENSDSVMIALEKSAATGPDVPISTLEAEVLGGTLKSNVQLALYRASSHEPTTDTARWLVHRDVALHHHVALDSDRDFARLGRFMRGEALGLVLCGGGSFGTAHLGVALALEKKGYDFDFIGGTSVGAALAAAMAIGVPTRDIMDVCDDLFVTSKAMSTLNIPTHGVLDHTILDRALQHHYGGHNIEDMPINYFAIATSLTHNDEVVMTRGPLWEAVRASTAVPGVFPPFIMEDGEVLIDGGILNNVPINVMRDLKTGPNLIMNFHAPRPWRAKSKYGDFPSRRQALTGLFRRKKRGPRKPTLFGILSRTMVVNSRRMMQHMELGEDVLLNISPLKGMGFMNWKRGRELFNVSHDRMNVAMDQAAERDRRLPGRKIAHLRAAADIINGVEAVD
ncbi:MAG: cyclic nucleotide-binding and patatin-like phospholipase domain-containing protein [Pseudomonadota bacterium]